MCACGMYGLMRDTVDLVSVYQYPPPPHNRTDALRRLLNACRLTGRAEAGSLVALLLGDRAAAIELMRGAGRLEDAAVLASGGAGMYV